MSDTTAEPIVKAYLRFVDDGLTLDGQVWRAGAVHVTEDIAMAGLTPAEQLRKWGFVAFELIGKDEYDVLKDMPAQNLRATRRATVTPPPPAMAHSANGEELTYDAGKAVPGEGAAHTLQPITIDKVLPDEQQQLPVDVDPSLLPSQTFTPPAVENPWPWYEQATDLETVQHLARLGEASVGEFIAFEREHKNRPAIVKLLTTGEM